MVIDALTREYSKGKLRYDRGGKIAQSGKVNQGLLGELLADPYYRMKPPKSAGREQYGAEFVARMKKSRLPLRDLIATATALTSYTIALSIAFSRAVEFSGLDGSHCVGVAVSTTLRLWGGFCTRVECGHGLHIHRSRY